ncbi:MAG: SDR family NAD(P)-dependent oxidoreductase [Chitinophagaceae bacterium]|nr:SDR family NAD(P)-dependent oxidoreductase [Chitinophagaceae bacterium]
MASEGTKTWFITGASSGFGKSFTAFAVRQGFNVVITARRIDRLNEMKALAPDQIEAIKMDVNNRKEIDQAVQRSLDRFGHIDVLINNAGYGVLGAVEETTEEELRAQMETNFFGVFNVTKAFVPIFRKQLAGAIVNISSLGGQLSFAGYSAYSASKFAVEGLSEALATELAPFNIRVMIVEPGAFRTELMAEHSTKQMTSLGEYDDTVGKTRANAEAMNGKQPGDPDKAATAIYKALLADKTPLRLQLGKDAVDMIRKHSETLLKDLAEWEHLALDTTFD